jgi:Flp pilus assembly protein TadD
MLPLLSLAIACRAEPLAFEPVVHFERQSLGIPWDELPKGEEARREARAATREGARWSQARDEVRALAHLRRAVDLDPQQVGAWRSLAAGFERLGDLDAALRVVREARGVWPRDPGLRDDLQRLAALAREPKAGSGLAPAWTPAARSPAAASVSRPGPAGPVGAGDQTSASEEQPEDAEGALLAGNELMERGEFAQAARAYENAVRRRPQEAEARRLLGWAFFQAGDFRAAVSAWEDLSRRQKLDPETARLLREARQRSR